MTLMFSMYIILTKRCINYAYIYMYTYIVFNLFIFMVFVVRKKLLRVWFRNPNLIKSKIVNFHFNAIKMFILNILNECNTKLYITSNYTCLM